VRRFLLILALFGGLAWAVPAQEPSGRQLYQQLNTLRVDAQRMYRVRDLSLRRDVVRFSFEEGKLALLTEHNGKITGAVFTGRGRVLAMPRDPGEKASLARFLGEPLLDQAFARAYLRFTDDTGRELLQQMTEFGAEKLDEPTFVTDWNLIVIDLNPWHSLRILTDLISKETIPYFYAGLMGERTGAFDVLIDDRRDEQVLLGQSRFVEGSRFYDVWASFPRTSGPRNDPLPFLPVRYTIDTTIQDDLGIEGKTVAEFKAVRGGERMLSMELSRRLSISAVTDENGRPLDFFQNEDVKGDELAQRGNDAIFVVLPAAPAAGESVRLRFAYKGGVISDAGNGVYFVGDRGSWYPHVGGADLFVHFELGFRWPKRLQLVVTGKKLEEKEEGDWKSGRWKSDVPIPVAGFNLGDYVSSRVDVGAWKVELFANRQLERAVQQRFSRPIVVRPVPGRGNIGVPPQLILPDPAPSPAAILNDLGRDIADSVKFYEKMSGPFPFSQLNVAQIPGSFGQGWPGLLYLSTLSFLTPAAQSRAGIGERTQAQFTELMPPHEVAHQWWGGVVGWGSYRDQWISEGLANYLALLYVNTKTPGDKELAWWMDTYRKELLQKDSLSGLVPNEIGPLTLGYRLRTSKAPAGFTQVVYSKGTWVIHMLRMMLRDPQAKDPDARFNQLLLTLLKDFRHRALTTADLQRAVEKVMTKEMDIEGGRSMDWFFDQWVSSTPVPRYSVNFSVKPTAAGDRFIVRGKLKQEGVPENFTAPVPLYAPRAVSGAKPALLGVVVTTGPETTFSFTSRSAPKKLLIDPYLSLLCLPD
jgi:hypothetical protein